MGLQTATSATAHDDRGAATLRDALLRNERTVWKEKLLRNIGSWQSAIKAEGEPTPEAVNVFNWYWKQVRTRSYQAPNWRIPAERTALFQKFRSDPCYHLKNLVEIVTRGLVEDMLRAEGHDAKVMITSDSDDVFSGVDFIVEIKSSGGSKSYAGFDLAISNNPEYLEQKALKTHTVCREFNQFMGWKKTPEWDERSMEREVFAISPKVMSGFLPEYMKRIAAGKPPSSKETLELLDLAKIRSTSLTRERTKSRVAAVLH